MISKKLVFISGLFVLIIFITFLIFNSKSAKSIDIICDPNQLLDSGLVMGAQNENVKNFNACLNFLGFYIGEPSNKYDTSTRDALKKFYVNIRRYNPNDPNVDLDNLSLAVNPNDLDLIKNMVNIKNKLNRAVDFNVLKKFNMPDNYSSFDKLTVDDNFKNILVSYRRKLNNKFGIIKVNVTSSNIISSGFYDNISELGFVKGTHYFKFFNKGKEYLAVYDPDYIRYFSYGPYDNIYNFRIYDNHGLGIIYFRNRFLYSVMGNISRPNRIGPFTTVDLKISPFEPKVGFASIDPEALDRVGEPVGYYLGIVSPSTSTTLSGFSVISNFNFAEEDDPNINYGGFVFSYKPLWVNQTSPNQTDIENFIKDWVYIEGKHSPCKDYKSFFDAATKDYQNLLGFLNNASHLSCQRVTGTSPIHQEFLEKIVSGNPPSSLSNVQKSMKAPLSVCGPYNRIYNLSLSPDYKRLAIVYSKDYLEGSNKLIAKGIAIVNLTKIFPESIGSGSCSLSSTGSANCTFQISDNIITCLRNLSRLVYSQSVGAFDFYANMDFDEPLSIYFSKANKLAFSYRKADRYYLNIFNYPSIAEVKEILPVVTYNFYSPVEKFAFSPDGQNYAFVTQEENINTGLPDKKIYVNNRIVLSGVKDNGDFVFSKNGNVLVFWYTLESDSNKYVKLIDLTSQNYQMFGPFPPTITIKDLILTNDGSKLAIVLLGENRMNYIYYDDIFYKAYLSGKIGFSNITDVLGNNYKLIVVYFKDELDNNNFRRGKLYVATPHQDPTTSDLERIINSMQPF